MSEYTKLKYRYFFLSFVTAFFVLSLMFLALMSIVHPKIPDSLVAEPDGDGGVYVPSPADALTVLFMGAADEDDVAGTYILARFDPEHGKIPIAVFPPQTAVRNNGREEPLSEVFRYGGAEYTREALSATLGVPIDRYVRMRLDAFLVAAAAVGTVEYELASNVRFERGGAPVSLSPGKQILDGQMAADLIRYQGYSGGELNRCRITGEIAAAIVNQRMDVCLSTVSDKIFEKIINLIATDISYTDYHERKPAAEFLARLEKAPAAPLAVSGTWSADKTRYTLSDTFLASLTQSFR